MNPKKPEVIRDAQGVAEYTLPEWDRQGNPVEPKAPPQKEVPPTPVDNNEDLNETHVSAPTVKELEAIREQAYNEGFEQGYEEGLKQGKVAGLEEGKAAGFAEGLEQGKDQGAAKAEQAAKLDYEKQRQETFAVFIETVNELKGYREQDQDALEHALASLSLRLAQQIIQDEMSLQPKHIIPVVHATVESLPNPDDSLTLYLNPLDIPIVSEVADSHWTLQPDESITRGGCQVKSGFSYVDYTLEHRFSSAVRSLLHHIKPPGAGSDTLTPLSEEPLFVDEESAYQEPIQQVTTEHELNETLPQNIDSSTNASSEPESSHQPDVDEQPDESVDDQPPETVTDLSSKPKSDPNDDATQ